MLVWDKFHIRESSLVELMFGHRMVLHQVTEIGGPSVSKEKIPQCRAPLSKTSLETMWVELPIICCMQKKSWKQVLSLEELSWYCTQPPCKWWFTIKYTPLFDPFRSMALAELVEFHRADIIHYVSSNASTASCRVLGQLHAIPDLNERPDFFKGTLGNM